MAFGDYQLEIYLQGLSGVLPSYPMAFAELEAKAQAAMSPSLWSYVAGGAGDERTQRANVTAFERWGVYPGSVRTPSPDSVPGARHMAGNENFQQGAFLKPGSGDPYIYSFGTPSGRGGLNKKRSPSRSPAGPLGKRIRLLPRCSRGLIITNFAAIWDKRGHKRSIAR